MKELDIITNDSGCYDISSEEGWFGISSEDEPGA